MSLDEEALDKSNWFRGMRLRPETVKQIVAVISECSCEESPRLKAVKLFDPAKDRIAIACGATLFTRGSTPAQITGLPQFRESAKSHGMSRGLVIEEYRAAVPAGGRCNAFAILPTIQIGTIEELTNAYRQSLAGCCEQLFMLDHEDTDGDPTPSRCRESNRLAQVGYDAAFAGNFTPGSMAVFRHGVVELSVAGKDPDELITDEHPGQIIRCMILDAMKMFYEANAAEATKVYLTSGMETQLDLYVRRSHNGARLRDQQHLHGLEMVFDSADFRLE